MADDNADFAFDAAAVAVGWIPPFDPNPVYWGPIVDLVADFGGVTGAGSAGLSAGSSKRDWMCVTVALIWAGTGTGVRRDVCARNVFFNFCPVSDVFTVIVDGAPGEGCGGLLGVGYAVVDSTDVCCGNLSMTWIRGKYHSSAKSDRIFGVGFF